MAKSTAVHQRYYTKDGEMVAGSTTILGVMAKPSLIRWAWNCGIKGEDYTKVRDSAGSVGTITHLKLFCSCFNGRCEQVFNVVAVGKISGRVNDGH